MVIQPVALKSLLDEVLPVVQPEGDQSGVQVVIESDGVPDVNGDPAMLRQARQRHPHLHLDEGDAETLPYADDSLDAVVSNFGVHHTSNPEKAIAEARLTTEAIKR